ncbi:tyrosine-type recombinase/integrase [Streptomyces sp. NPDC048362]|uniref:tyrosine-type recombinase/integrase n=1 Tax=Streptomyces sp. NPDC048362 TaxID=3365539 RepID=UPI0037132B6D
MAQPRYIPDIVANVTLPSRATSMITKDPVNRPPGFIANCLRESGRTAAADDRPDPTTHPELPSRPPSTHTTVERAWSMASRWSAPLYERPGRQGPRLLGSAWVDGGRDGSSPRTPPTDPQSACRSSSVRAPKLDHRRIVPWQRECVLAVRSALSEQYRPMVDLAGGCGLRQGEVLGLAVEDVNFIDGVVHVVRQVKLIRNRPVFAPPKGAKERTVPLPDSVARSIEEHISQHPPASVTLPWRAVDGAPVTASLILHRDQGRPINRNDFNRGAWRPALEAAGVPLGRASGMHALRHFYASVLLDAGESIKALSEYLGHHDPGFTLRTYTHLMPSSEKRTREAVNRAFADGPDTDDGPTTAQGE